MGRQAVPIRAPAFQPVERLLFGRNRLEVFTLHPALHGNRHRLAGLGSVTVRGDRHEVGRVDQAVRIHVVRLLHLTAERVVFVQRHTARRSHTLHHLTLRIVIPHRFGAVRIDRLILAAELVGTGRFSLRQCPPPVRTVFVGLSTHRGPGNAGHLARRITRDLRRTVRTGHRIRRDTVAVSRHVAERIGRGGQASVDITARSRDLAAVAAGYRGRKQVPGLIVGVEGRDSVANRMIRPAAS